MTTGLGEEKLCIQIKGALFLLVKLLSECSVAMIKEKETTTLDYKTMILIILLGVKASVVWVRETDRQTDRGRWMETAIFWSITSSLDHTMLCYLQGLTRHFFCLSAGGYSTKSPLLVAVGCCPSGVPSRSLSFLWLAYQPLEVN